MRALQCTELGGPDKLEINEVESPSAIPGHVVIDVKSGSINFPDVLMIQGLYQYQPPLPFTPGGESAGIISEIGDGVTKFKVGDKVFAMTGTGAFAEKILAHENSCTLIPDSMDYDSAAALSMTYGTSLYALKQRAKIQPGETLLVLGASGGVGIAAIELGKAMGARVIAAASTQDKIDMCMAHGADEGFIYPSGNLDREQQKQLSNKIKELTGGMGANVVYDPIGDSYAEPCLRATAWEGRYLVIGFAAETNNVQENAQKKLIEKNCDWIIANDVSNNSIGFDSDFNEVSIFYKNKEIENEKLAIKKKSEISEEIADRVIKQLN